MSGNQNRPRPGESFGDFHRRASHRMERGPAWLQQVAAKQTKRRSGPAEPSEGSVWYGNWECGYEPERGNWTGEGYVAYKGGCDLDARYVTASTWDKLLEAVDDEEEV